jgi:hypothetical protein
MSITDALSSTHSGTISQLSIVFVRAFFFELYIVLYNKVEAGSWQLRLDLHASLILPTVICVVSHCVVAMGQHVHLGCGVRYQRLPVLLVSPCHTRDQLLLVRTQLTAMVLP